MCIIVAGRAVPSLVSLAASVLYIFLDSRWGGRYALPTQKGAVQLIFFLLIVKYDLFKALCVHIYLHIYLVYIHTFIV